jgi:hypothetical protein
MGGVSHLPRRPPAAGQAAVEYVALLLVLGAALLAAGPAVGAPAIPRQVVHGVRLGLCIVTGDVCTAREATAAGLPPCPMSSRVDGSELGLTLLSIDLGTRGTVTLTPRSDGTVAASWSAGVYRGVSGGWGLEASAGPLHLEAGAFGGAGIRMSEGRGWTFSDALTARRFAAGLPGSLTSARWPADWTSLEAGPEASAMVGAAVGHAGGALSGIDVSATGSLGLGARVTRDHVVTLYLRASLDGPEVSLPFLQAPGRGRTDLVAEYTFGPGGPRSLVLRRALPSRSNHRLTETVATLDLSDPANWAVAAPAIARLRTPSGKLADLRALLARIRTAGTTQRYVSAVNDSTTGVALAFGEGLKFGVSGSRIKIRRRLIDARAWTPGSASRARADCLASES